MAQSKTGKQITRSANDRKFEAYAENGKWGVVRLVQNVTMGETYEAATFNVSTGTTDYDVDAQQSALFNDRTYANYINIRTDQVITVKFNSTDNASITIETTDSPYIVDFLETHAIFISNSSGNTASVQVLLV